MRWEELKTPEAVMAAFEAGRHVEFTCEPDGWIVPTQKGRFEPAEMLRMGCSYRALIEDAPQEFEDDAADREAEVLTRRALGEGKINPDATSVSDLFIGDDDEDAPPVPEGFTPWPGGECPEDAASKLVEYMMRCGQLAFEVGSDLRWNHDGTDGDIIAYRLERPERQGEAGIARQNNHLCAHGSFETWRDCPVHCGVRSIPVESLGRDADDGVDHDIAKLSEYLADAGYPEDGDAMLTLIAIARRLRPQVDEAKIPDAVRRAINSADLYGVLTDVQNGIDSPGLASMANSAIRKIDAARAALTTSPEADNGK